MVQIDSTYEGQLHCTAIHGPSGSTLATDAPKDNMGRGEAFSPTDLLATSLLTCMLTTMGIVAQRHGWALEGATGRVVKEMVSQPSRRVGTLTVHLRLPTGSLGPEERQRLENAAHSCPVARSLHPDVRVAVTFEWL
jgi:putative redox protein